MGMTDYCFSFFRKPIQNIEPIRAVGIVDVYRYIIGHYAQPQTEALRLMLSSPEAKSTIVEMGGFVSLGFGRR